jgi:hypothetical protein
MNGVIQWSDVVPIVSVLGVFLGGLWTVWNWIQRIRDDVAKVRLEMATALLNISKEYVSASTLKDTEDRLVGAIERLGDRFDRALELRSHSPRP